MLEQPESPSRKPDKSTAPRHLIVCLGSSLLMVCAVFAVDYASIRRTESLVKILADSGARSAARVFPLINVSADDIAKVRELLVGCQPGAATSRRQMVDGEELVVTTTKVDGHTKLQVEVMREWSPVFGKFSFLGPRMIRAQSKASLQGLGVVFVEPNKPTAMAKVDNAILPSALLDQCST